jgi:integrin beta 3
MDGKDGKDGLGLDDMIEEYADDGRTLVRRYLRDGNVIKEFQHRSAAMLYRGVWRSKSYLKGDVVTHGGSSFVALADTDAKPELSSDWQLANKRGRDGKDGKDGRNGERGPAGRDGRNHWET